MRWTRTFLGFLVVACGGSPDASSPDGSAAGAAAASGGSAAVTGGAGGVGSRPTGGAAGAAAATGGGAPGSGGSGAGQPGTSIRCVDPVEPGLPEGAPALTAGTWVDIRPPGITWGENGHATGFALSPCNPSVLYAGIGSFDSSTGVFRSADAGATWTRIAGIDPEETGGVDHINGGAMIRVDPGDPQRVYFVSGVRGVMGFFRSFDAGDTVEIPQGFRDIGDSVGIFQWDVYDIATDPTDFDHVLLSFHGAWGWTETKWNTNSGVLESTDGGDTWVVHEPLEGWGTGHAIHFLYNPELGLGDPSTWLLGTQGSGMWRTTDAGRSWVKATDANIQHGGGKIYYTASGVLYATGADRNLRSTDNGASFETVGPGGGYNGIIGDGERLYTARCFGPTPIITSPETDGTTWTDFSSQEFQQGPFELGFDPVNRIVYGSFWSEGVRALKVD